MMEVYSGCKASTSDTGHWERRLASRVSQENTLLLSARCVAYIPALLGVASHANLLSHSGLCVLWIG